MSGAGVAFPVQIISSPRHSSSELCFSSALPGNPVPMPCTSSPRLCPASPLLCSPLPLPFCANPARCGAHPARCGAWAGVAFPMQILAYLCLSRTGLCFSGALRVQALPQPCGLLHIPCLAGPRLSGAERHEAIPVHFIALHCPALPLLSELRQCTVLLCYSGALPNPAEPWRRQVIPRLCASRLRLSGAYLLGPLPAPFSPW